MVNVVLWNWKCYRLMSKSEKPDEMKMILEFSGSGPNILFIRWSCKAEQGYFHHLSALAYAVLSSMKDREWWCFSLYFKAPAMTKIDPQPSMQLTFFKSISGKVINKRCIVAKLLFCAKRFKVAPYSLALSSVSFNYSLPDSVAENSYFNPANLSSVNKVASKWRQYSLPWQSKKRSKIGYFGPFEANNLSTTRWNFLFSMSFCSIGKKKTSLQLLSKIST